MVNRNKRIAVLVSLMICLMCLFFGVACVEQKPNVQLRENTKKYYVGDSISCYDFIEREVGVNYSFSVTGDNGEVTDVIGQTYYAKTAGRYSLLCTATKNQASASLTAQFDVYDTKPYLAFVGPTSVDVDTRLTVPMLISRIDPLIVSDTETTEYFTVATVTTMDGMKETYDLTQENKYFDGKFFTFIDEGTYVLHLIVENAGGKVECDVTIKAKVNFGILDNVEGATLDFDYSTYTASWSEVEGAEKYLVRLNNKTVTVENATSLNILPELTSDFAYFTLYVVPVNAAGNKMGKIEYSDVLISPDGYENVILGGEMTKVVDEHVVSMPTKQVYSRSASEIDGSEDNYVAFKGDYGVGTYVDFEFTGNNMPAVRLFANKINGYFSSNGNSNCTGNQGILMMNGLVTSEPHKDHVSELKDLRIYGPKMLTGSYLGQWHFHTITYDEFPYFTQTGLSEATDSKFKYTVGSYEDSRSLIRVHLILSVERDGQWVELYNQKIYTGISVSDLSGTDIIALAPLKGNDEVAFKFSQPYNWEAPGTVDPDGLECYNGVYNDDGSVTLETKIVENCNSGMLELKENSYLAFSDKYSAGTYVDFEFTGNNMPMVRLYANEINGRISNYNNELQSRDDTKGILLINGLTTKGIVEGHDSVLNEFRIYAPNTITSSYLNKSAALAVYSYDEYPYMTQQGLQEAADTLFKYTVGSYLDANNNVYVHALLYKSENDEWVKIHEIKANTGVKSGDLNEGYIVAMAPIIGEGSATFKYSMPYRWKAPGTVDPDGMSSYNAIYNSDGTVTLTTRSAYNLNRGQLGAIKNNYIAYEGNYGVGTYVDFEFIGNNMPIIRLFANDISGNISNWDTTANDNAGGVDETTTGLVLINGIVTDSTDSTHASVLKDYRIYGPNSIASSYLPWADVKPIVTYAYDTHPYLTQQGLSEAETTKFKYTVGTYLDEDDTIIVQVILSREENGIWVECYNLTQDTGCTEEDLPAGNIIVMAPIKGVGTATFAFSQPYIYGENNEGTEDDNDGNLEGGDDGNNDGNSNVGGGDNSEGNGDNSKVDTSEELDDNNGDFIDGWQE